MKTRSLLLTFAVLAFAIALATPEVNAGWTTLAVVSTESTSSSYAPSVAVDSGGNVHVVWYDYTDYGGSGTDRDIFYKWFDGVGWTTTAVVSTESTSSSYAPSVAVDSDGNVHVVWYDYSEYSIARDFWSEDVFYKWFDGVGWTTTAVVSGESTDDAYAPSVVVDSDGNVHVVWSDGSNIGGSGGDPDIFYKNSSAIPMLVVAPDTGFASTTIVGSGYFSAVEITITWNGIPIPTIPSPLTADGYGNFTAFISVPTPVNPGSYTIAATNKWGDSAQATFTVVDMAGPQGEAGSAGSQGEAGSAGSQGETGSAGPQGGTGSAGPQGDTGPAGETPLMPIVATAVPSVIAIILAAYALTKKKP